MGWHVTHSAHGVHLNIKVTPAAGVRFSDCPTLPLPRSARAPALGMVDGRFKMCKAEDQLA